MWWTSPWTRAPRRPWRPSHCAPPQADPSCEFECAFKRCPTGFSISPLIGFKALMLAIFSPPFGVPLIDLSISPPKSSAPSPLPPLPLVSRPRVRAGSVVHVVAHIAAVRRLSRQLLFADLLPAGAALDAERSIWPGPDYTERKKPTQQA